MKGEVGKDKKLARTKCPDSPLIYYHEVWATLSNSLALEQPSDAKH
jgi:hypothetical protein